MKKLLFAFVCVVALVANIRADVQTVSMNMTNGQPLTVSDQIPASGMLDKIEISQSYATAATSAVVVATFASDNSTPVDVYATNSLTSAKIIRLRVVPTDNTGTAISAAVSTGTYSNTTTILTVPYERVMLGGNIRCAVGCTSFTAALTNVVTFRLFYSPILSK